MLRFRATTFGNDCSKATILFSDAMNIDYPNQSSIMAKIYDVCFKTHSL